MQALGSGGGASRTTVSGAAATADLPPERPSMILIMVASESATSGEPLRHCKTHRAEASSCSATSALHTLARGGSQPSSERGETSTLARLEQTEAAFHMSLSSDRTPSLSGLPQGTICAPSVAFIPPQSLPETQVSHIRPVPMSRSTGRETSDPFGPSSQR